LLGATTCSHAERLLVPAGLGVPYRRVRQPVGTVVHSPVGRVPAAVSFRVVHRRSHVCMSRCAVSQPGPYGGPGAGRCRCRRRAM